MKSRRGIRLLAECGREPGHIELRGDEIALEVLAVRLVDRIVEFYQDVAGLHALAVSDIDCSNDADFKRLDDLGAARRHDLARGRGDDVDASKSRPTQAHAEEG